MAAQTTIMSARRLRRPEFIIAMSRVRAFSLSRITASSILRSESSNAFSKSWCIRLSDLILSTASCSLQLCVTSFAISSIFCEMDSAFVPESHLAILGENCANESAACSNGIDIFISPFLYIYFVMGGGAMWYARDFTTLRPLACQGTLRQCLRQTMSDSGIAFAWKP